MGACTKSLSQCKARNQITLDKVNWQCFEFNEVREYQLRYRTLFLIYIHSEKAIFKQNLVMILMQVVFKSN